MFKNYLAINLKLGRLLKFNRYWVIIKDFRIPISNKT